MTRIYATRAAFEAAYRPGGPLNSEALIGVASIGAATIIFYDTQDGQLVLVTNA